MTPVTWAAWFMGLLSTPTMVMGQAEQYGVNPRLAACVCQHESNWNTTAISPTGTYRGLWQWMLPSFKEIRKEMGKADWERDLRLDAWVSTEAAMWAMANGHENYWPTLDLCKGEHDVSKG